MKFKIKILFVFLIIFSISVKINAQSQTINKLKANLFYKITEQLIFGDQSSKIEYYVETYGCSEEFVKELERLKPGVFSDQKYHFSEYNPNANVVDFDILIVDESKNSKLSEIYKKLKKSVDNNNASVVLITSNWSNKEDIIINYKYKKNSDVLTFEYNIENLNKFNTNATKEIHTLNGIDLGAKKMLDKTRKELKEAENKLREKEKQLQEITKELQTQQAKINEQKTQLNEQQKLIEQKQLEIKKQQSRLQNIQAEMKETEYKLEQQKRNFANKEKALNEKQQEILVFQSKIEEMQKRFSEQSKIIEEKTAELDKKTTEIEKVNKQIEQKREELGDLNNIIKWQRYALIIFAFLLALIVILAIWIFRNYRKMRQQNKVLEQQKNEISAQAEELEKANLELEKLSIVASKTSNAVAILDHKGRFEWLNAGFTKLYGYTLQLLKNELNENIENNALYRGIKKTFHKAVDEKKSYYFEHQTFSRDRKKIWVQTAITPIVDYEGNLKQVVLVDSDISVIKQAEEKIAKQNKNIRNSIKYASRIQKATLPSTRILLNYLPNSFILYLPRDIVSGDFYWSAKVNGKIFFAAADCTGHGVPGAFMSMLGITLLNETIASLSDDKLFPNFVLDSLRDKLITALKQSKDEESNKDGIAIALCMVEKNSNIIHYAGAENEMILVRNKEIFSYKADDMLISIPVKGITPFSDKKVEYQKDDMIYLFSDGYPDQFGGPGKRRKKFMIKRLRDLFAKISDEDMGEQKDILLEKHLDWKGENKQLDDIIIMGVRM